MNFAKAVLIAESRYYNKVLHPRFWSNDTFDEGVRKKILKIVDDFFGEPENATEIDDIQLTGSLANYNYTKHSDLDVHILLDFSKINNDTDLVKRALDGKRFIWNLRYDITIGGQQIELYYQDTNEPHIASGLYSLKDGEWIIKPEYNPPSIDERDVLKKAEGIADIINRFGDEVDQDIDSSKAHEWYTHAKKLKNKLAKMRSKGLHREGEFSIENLAFKELRNNGSIGKLIKIISTSYGKIYSESTQTVEEEIKSFVDIFKKNTDNTVKSNINKKGPQHQQSHRGITRKRQTWVPDFHKITKDDIVQQKVEKSKEDNIGRIMNKLEVLKACNKYGINVKTLMTGKVKQLGTSRIKMWYDGKNFFIQGGKKHKN